MRAAGRRLAAAAARRGLTRIFAPCPAAVLRSASRSANLTADITVDALRLPEDGGAAPEGKALGTAGALIARGPVPLGADAAAVATWFDEVVEAEAPILDGSLAAERGA